MYLQNAFLVFISYAAIEPTATIIHTCCFTQNLALYITLVVVSLTFSIACGF